VLLDARAWIHAVEQQLSYFATASIANQAQYQKALGVTKNTISQKHELSILLSLLNNQYSDFEETTLQSLPVNADARLAYAEWLSQSGRFEQAQAIFTSIQRIFPSVITSFLTTTTQNWSFMFIPHINSG
jgi:hypothetical protein